MLDVIEPIQELIGIELTLEVSDLNPDTEILGPLQCMNYPILDPSLGIHRSMVS